MIYQILFFSLVCFIGGIVVGWVMLSYILGCLISDRRAFLFLDNRWVGGIEPEFDG